MSRATFQSLRSWKRGLTLGEMLVVLAVFMILAVMFFISSNLAITKTKRARVMAEHKDLMRALFVYEGEFHAIPNETLGLDALTHTPVTLVRQVPIDPFTGDNNGKKQEYGYYSDVSPTMRWIIVSVGPNGKPDLDRAIVRLRRRIPRAAMAPAGERRILMNDKMAHDFITNVTYDPTNGAMSAGDIITIYN